jgi:hypothetical protein
MLAAALAGLTGCEQPPEAADPADLAVVSAAVTQVPSNGTCVRFTTIGGPTPIQQTFDGTTGMPLTATLNGLPYGRALTITADAFAGACSALTAKSVATYISDAQAVTLVAGGTKALSFTLRPTASVTATTDFLYITISQTSKDFGALFTGQSSAAWTLTVANIGMIPTSALTTTLAGTTADFVVGPNTCGTLAAGATCTIQVKFVPKTAGAKNLTLTVSGPLGGTVTATATGTAQLGAKLVATPASLDFGTLTAFSQSPNQLVTIENQGDQTASGIVCSLVSPDFALAGGGTGGPGNYCPTTLAGHTSFQVPVQAWNSPTVGTHTATMTITSAPGGTASVSMTGTFTVPMTVTPTSWTFGSVPLTVVGQTQVFNIKNNSTTDSPILTVTSTHPAFQPTLLQCASLGFIPLLNSCQLNVLFQPTVKGVQTGTITVSGPVPTLYSVQVTVSGTGT